MNQSVNPAHLSRRAQALVPLAMGAAVVLAYLSSFAGSFQFDDFNVIVDNPVVHSLAAWWADVPHGIRPLLKLSYTLNWMVDQGAAGFHVVNLAIHLVNTALVYQLTHLAARALTDASTHTARPIAPLVAALLFALHPAQTEAVTYISGRSASLMATFCLGAVLAFVAGTTRHRRLWSPGLSPVLFVLAVATKESAIALPLLLLVWQLCRHRPVRVVALLQSLWPHALALVGVAVLLLNHPVYTSRLVPDLGTQALHRHVLTAVTGLAHLATQLLLPWPLNIDPDLRPGDTWTSTLAQQALVLVMTIGAAAWAWRHRPWLGLAVAWFFVVLLPTNSLLPRLDIANDRQLYLAGVGLFMAIGIEVDLAWPRWRHWPGLVTVATLIVFAALTTLRNLDYRSEVRLWQQTTAVSPHKARAFNNLGHAYSAAGCGVLAEAAYRHALALNPNYPLARDNLASLIERGMAASAPGC